MLKDHVNGQGGKMPKKVSIVLKRQWLEAFERGKSEKAIAETEIAGTSLTFAR